MDESAGRAKGNGEGKSAVQVGTGMGGRLRRRKFFDGEVDRFSSVSPVIL